MVQNPQPVILRIIQVGSSGVVKALLVCRHSPAAFAPESTSRGCTNVNQRPSILVWLVLSSPATGFCLVVAMYKWPLSQTNYNIYIYIHTKSQSLAHVVWKVHQTAWKDSWTKSWGPPRGTWPGDLGHSEDVGYITQFELIPYMVKVVSFQTNKMKIDNNQTVIDNSKHNKVNELMNMIISLQIINMNQTSLLSDKNARAASPRHSSASMPGLKLCNQQGERPWCYRCYDRCSISPYWLVVQ